METFLTKILTFLKSLHENKEAESLSSISIIFDAHNLQLPTVNHDSTDSLMWQGTMPHKTYLFRSITAYKEKYLFKAYNNRETATGKFMLRQGNGHNIPIYLWFRQKS